MKANFLSIAMAALAVLAQQAYACTVAGTSECPQNCEGPAQNMCHLPGGYCKCEPY
ncbi:hypothetical protein C8034_v000264 [Colletotrichum sidae]|uniref:Uncharacterized protein n=1 Tax=Colletotrichum sidae TaxID=1347389 RepID=A0A4R8THY1_9PEZI|nr:hypothetical protein C8034_v000264 [Colletotrichum sidae]